MNLNIYGRDLNLANVMHLERWGSDDWRWTGENYAGMLRGDTNNAISAVADAVGNERVHEIYVTNTALTVRPDRSGNAWIDGEYMSSSQWIPFILNWTDEGA